MSILPLIPTVFDRLTDPPADPPKEEIQTVRTVEVELNKPPAEIRNSRPVTYREKVETRPPAMMQMVEARIVKEGSPTATKESGKGEDRTEQPTAGREFNTSLRDDKGTDAGQLAKEVERINRELAEGQARYEIGLREAEAAGRRGTSTATGGKSGSTGSSGGGSGGATKNNEQRKEKSKGDVFVSYELDARTDTYLHIPAYQCQYGGMVVVAIQVNRNGKVVSANVERSTSGQSDCIEKMALQSALASSFTSSGSAPDKQRGTITYRFVSQ